MPITWVAEVAAVVEVEAAQEVLVGLSRPRVLGDDQAGHGLQRASAGRSGGQLRNWAAVTVPSLAESATPDQLMLAGGDGDLLERRDAGGLG